VRFAESHVPLALAGFGGRKLIFLLGAQLSGLPDGPKVA
jgi:hypothetical protein